MKKIYINESALILLREYKDEVTFKKFFDHIKDFLQGLLDDPFTKEFDSFFTNHGITKENLMKLLSKRGIIKKKESFKEETNESKKDKMHSVHTVKYSVPRGDFKKKIRRIYSELFESTVNECDCGGVSAGATNAAGVGNCGSGQFVQPLGGVQSRGDIYQPTKKRSHDFKNGSMMMQTVDSEKKSKKKK